MLLCLAATLAFAGDLLVTTANPIAVSVDGRYVDYTPGTMMVQVSGLSGIHRVDIVSMRGDVLQTLNVNVPYNGVAQLVFDGRSLLVASTGLDVAPAPAPVSQSPQVMDPAAFEALLGAVDGVGYWEDKLATIATAASRRRFTVDQVGQLVDRLGNGADGVEVVRTCRDKIVDPENAFMLGARFSYDQDREAVLAMFQ